MDEDSSIIGIRKHNGDRPMTYTAYSGDFVPFRSHSTVSRVAEPRPGILRRIFDAFFESRRRQAEREIARYLERTGGRLTDDVELQMTRRLLGGEWNVRD
jgi:hypothetical protein